MPPADIVEAAKRVARWFDQREIHNWVLEGCRARYVRESTGPSRGTDLDIPEELAIESTAIARAGELMCNAWNHPANCLYGWAAYGMAPTPLLWSGGG